MCLKNDLFWFHFMQSTLCMMIFYGFAMWQTIGGSHRLSAIHNDHAYLNIIKITIESDFIWLKAVSNSHSLRHYWNSTSHHKRIKSQNWTFSSSQNIMIIECRCCNALITLPSALSLDFKSVSKATKERREFSIEKVTV